MTNDSQLTAEERADLIKGERAASDPHLHDDPRPWDTAYNHAKALEKALLYWAYTEGSCNGDWSEKALRLQSLHTLAENIIKEIEAEPPQQGETQ